MAHDIPSETIRYLGWRLAAFLGIVLAIGLMLSKDSVRYGAATTELRVPVTGVDARDLIDSFRDPRDEGRMHEAIDIPAPRGTLVVAAVGGRVRRIFSSASGGLGVYQIDSSTTRCLYYAHLERYAEGLAEGRHLNAGDPIGYVGTTGNAPDEHPHLHFAVVSLSETARCGDGRAINPLTLLR